MAVSAMPIRGVTVDSTTYYNNASGANDSSDKLYIIGAKAQDNAEETYSNSNVYEQAGTLTATGLSVTTINGVTVGNDPKFTDTTYTPSDTSPAMDGTAAAGSFATYARGDHVHPSDTSRVPTTRTVNLKALSSDITLDKTDIGLGNVDNTSDADKPISTAQQNALDLKAPLASPALTGTPTTPTPTTLSGDTQIANKKYVDDAITASGFAILSYGTSTWQNFIDVYSTNRIVYCRASSNTNPATGSQNRLAFMAYVNNADPTQITNVEFQYYRSVNSHSISQQGDQVYVYKLDKNSGWSVTVREAYTEIVAGTGMGSSYSSGTLTLTASGEVNQNAFSNIAVGATTIEAESTTDTLTLIAGSNVTLTPDATDDTITISATDTNTTYTFENGTNGFTVTPSGGSAQTVTVTPSITIDTAMSDSSTDAVQNKVIKKYVDDEIYNAIGAAIAASY